MGFRSIPHWVQAMPLSVSGFSGNSNPCTTVIQTHSFLVNFWWKRTLERTRRFDVQTVQKTAHKNLIYLCLFINLQQSELLSWHVRQRYNVQNVARFGQKMRLLYFLLPEWNKILTKDFPVLKDRKPQSDKQLTLRGHSIVTETLM